MGLVVKATTKIIRTTWELKVSIAHMSGRALKSHVNQLPDDVVLKEAVELPNGDVLLTFEREEQEA